MAMDYLTVPRPRLNRIRKFFSKIKIDPSIAYNGIPCWLWIGGIQIGNRGYGITSVSDKSEYIHRVMYAWLVEPVPRSSKYGTLDHLCRRRHCCNPCHLEFVSSRVNTLRGETPAAKNAAKTHCSRGGHPLSGANLIALKGRRACRTCQNLLKRLQRQKRKALGLPYT